MLIILNNLVITEVLNKNRSIVFHRELSKSIKVFVRMY